MSLLWRLIFTGRCTSTHHKLALDSLRFLRGPMADVWSNLFLANHEQYLAGSKAPDVTFKDFKNHVLHVEQGFWGGATLSARAWYQKTVIALNQGNWPDAVYNAGVLSHYFTDPFQPFHTDQCEAEGKVHRAAEWSIAKSYDELQAILEHDLGGYPQYELPERPDWLEEAIRAGATEAHASYHLCIDHYDLSRGIKNPPSGLDQEMKDRLAHLIGLASVGFSRVLERAFEEAAVTPPDVAVSLHAFLASLKVPLNWVMRKITDAHERAIVEAIYLEVQETGKAIDSLPEDEKVVRKLHAQEVLRIPMRQLDAEPARPTGSLYGTGKPARGLTVKTSGAVPLDRMSVSSLTRLDSSSERDAASGLESCLMVPLAANNPIDHVADTALRALLSQSMNQKPTSAMSPAAQVTAQWLNRGSLPAPDEQSEDDFGPQRFGGQPALNPNGAFVSGSNFSRPVASAPTANFANQSSKSQRSVAEPTSVEKQSSRKKSRIPAASYPEITPPSTTLGATSATMNYSPPVAGYEEAMFAPLPPMPRVRNREPMAKRPDGTGAVATQAAGQSQSGRSQAGSSQSSKSQQASSQSAGTKPLPTTASQNAAQSRPSQQNPLPVRPQPAPRVVADSPPPPARNWEARVAETRAQEQRAFAQKSFSAEPPSSPIPVPHIRTDDMPSDDMEPDLGLAEGSMNIPAASQQAPRIVVSSLQSAGQPVNRLSNITPTRPSSAPQGRSESMPTRAQNVNFDFQTTSGPMASTTGSAQPAVPLRPGIANPPGRSEVAQSSLFAALNSPPVSRPEIAPAKPAAPSQPVASAAPATPRPNMFQRPISAPPAPVVVPVPVPLPATPPVQTTIQTKPGNLARAESVQSAPVALDATPDVRNGAANQAEDASAPTASDATASQRGRRFYLELNSPLKEAPSIGPKTAELFDSLGVKTVFDLFRINTDRAAEKLGKPHLTAAVLKDWQAQALLVCRVPDLRGHDAQFLVACGIRTAEQLANCDPQALLAPILEFVATSNGQRILRGGQVPDLEEVTSWITAGRNARSLRNE
jgi:hypothetical protein